jgi:hypothetical protein
VYTGLEAKDAKPGGDTTRTFRITNQLINITLTAMDRIRSFFMPKYNENGYMVLPERGQEYLGIPTSWYFRNKPF